MQTARAIERSDLIVDTRRLFYWLLRLVKPETVCDIGSMDGYDALRFRRALPEARVIALEPNPRNFALMAADERLQVNSIDILPVAASDLRSEQPFFVVAAEYSPGCDRFRRGMSSLHRRSDGSRLAEIVNVRTERLDELLATERRQGTTIALWIDTEGMAYEVIDGARAILPLTLMLHVEVETRPIIGRTQRVFEDVAAALSSAGFVKLATDQPVHYQQLNALYIRGDLLDSKSDEILYLTKLMQLRHKLASNVARFVPARVRRKLADVAYRKQARSEGATR